MADTLFYSDPRSNTPNPCTALDARKAIYGTNFRSSGDHAWLTKKMAYANASAFHKLSNRKSGLSIPHGGGISGNGLYEPGQSSAGKWNPKPHITSVKISNDGDFGSILKCELAFTVYNLGDLAGAQAFFDLGAELTVNYGWNQAGGGGGVPGRFKGMVYNFSYQVTPVGGFDCVCQGMSQGTTILSAQANAAAESADKITDALGNTIIGNSISNLLSVKSQKALEAAQAHGAISNDIGTLMLPSSYGAAESAPAAPGTPESDKPHSYITLRYFVKLLVSRLRAAAGSMFDDVSILCTPEITKINEVTDPKKLVSANYMEVVFPGYGDYGGDHDYGFKESGIKMGSDASSIMLNIKWLTSQIDEMGKTKDDNQKSVDMSTSKLLGIVFDSIYNNSGTRFKLTLVQNPKKGKEKEFWIQDLNYIDKRIQPYQITAVTNNSICRSISLQSKIPSAMATMAFIGTDSSATGKSNMTALSTQPPKASPTAMQDLTEAKKPMDAKDPKSEDSPVGPVAANVSALQAALKRVYVEPESGSNNKNEAIPYPIDFSCTLDGVEGFIFGNLITTNYLPAVYKTNKIAFTVTKVEQNISANDWTTTLSTVCRLLT
jgi:hypothetical protein